MRAPGLPVLFPPLCPGPAPCVSTTAPVQQEFSFGAALADIVQTHRLPGSPALPGLLWILRAVLTKNLTLGNVLNFP